VLLALLVEEDGITQQELVRRVYSDPNTIRAMLVLLEKRGLVARDPHPADSRARRVTLTAKGRRTHKQLWADTGTVRQRLLTALGPADTTALVEVLARLARVMAQPPAPPAHPQPRRQAVVPPRHPVNRSVRPTRKPIKP
jgi:DNA-binding MarR family transcriptional regulator